MSKKTNEINYSLFLKKEQIKDLQSLFEIEQNNWLKQKASFIAYFNHCLALTRQQIKAGKIKLNKNQTDFNKGKNIYIEALKLAGLDENFIYNNTRYICNPEVVKKLSSDNPEKVLKSLEDKHIGTLEDFKEKISGKPKKEKTEKKEKEVKVEVALTQFQEAQLIAEKIKSGVFTQDSVKLISNACLLVQSTPVVENPDPVVNIKTGTIKTNKKKTGTNG